MKIDLLTYTDVDEWFERKLYSTRGRVLVFYPESESWVAFQDGWNVNAYVTGKYGVPLEDAIAALFPARSHGYEIGWYATSQNGDVFEGPICADCVRKEAQDQIANNEPDDEFEVIAEVIDGDQMYERDITCEWCCTLMQPQICVECGDADNLDDGFEHEYGYRMHPHCLARLVVKGDAHKTGLGRYEVDRHEHWCGGTYTRIAD